MQGQRCPGRACTCRLHDICTQNFFRTQKSRKCPLCQTGWTGNDFVGERAAVAGQVRKRKNVSGGGAMIRRQSPVVVAEDEEEQEGEEDDGDDDG